MPSDLDIKRKVVPHYAVRWRQLGLAIGMTSNELDIIKTDFPDSCESRCHEMLRNWLKYSSSPASWGNLLDAINSSELLLSANKG